MRRIACAGLGAILLSLAATASVGACGGGGGTGGGGSGGAASSSSASSSSAASSTGSGGAVPGCPDAPADVSGACDKPATLACPYASACDPAGCTLRCIGQTWMHLCEPCVPPVVACPTTPPAHGSACTGAENSGLPCYYDACASADDFATATCVGGAFQVDHTLCEAPGCEVVSGEDNVKSCPASSLCVDPPACEVGWKVGGCVSNPCAHEAASCACAGSLCGDGTVCIGVKNGHVLCAPPPTGNDPVMIVSGLGPVEEVRFDAASIWLSGGVYGATPKYAVRRAPIGGGPASVFAPTTSTVSIAVTPSTVYFAELMKGEIYAAPIAGGAPALLVSGEVQPKPLTAGASDLFWLAGASGAIRRSSLTAGPATTLASPAVGGVLALSADGSDVYWAEVAGRVARQPLDGSPAVDLAMGASVTGIALDATHVYFADYGGGAIGRVPKAGGPVEIVVSGLGAPLSIAVDATDVYWTDNFHHAIGRAPKAGGPAVEIATHQSGNEIHVDAAHVYWSTYLEEPCGGVFRMVK